MPFISDIEGRDEARGPIWGPFATIRDAIERLVAVNIAWAVQLAPGTLALAFPQLPLWLRIVMGLYSATAAVPATAVLYDLALMATQGEHISLEMAKQSLRALTRPAFRKLAPLYGVFGGLIWVAVLAGPSLPAVTTLATLLSLIWYLCVTYWGPLFVTQPELTFSELARRSAQLVWRYPAETLATGLVAAGGLLVGVVSVAGVVLIVPVLIALLHTWRYLDLAARLGVDLTV